MPTDIKIIFPILKWPVVDQINNSSTFLLEENYIFSHFPEYSKLQIDMNRQDAVAERLRRIISSILNWIKNKMISNQECGFKSHQRLFLI